MSRLILEILFELLKRGLRGTLYVILLTPPIGYADSLTEADVMKIIEIRLNSMAKEINGQFALTKEGLTVTRDLFKSTLKTETEFAAAIEDLTKRVKALEVTCGSR